MSTVIGALDIGTQTTVLLAAEVEGEEIRLLGHAATPTYGVKKGVIRDIEQVTGCIKRVRTELAAKFKIDLYDVAASFSAGDIKHYERSGRKSLMDGHAITEEDIDEAEDNAYAPADADAQELPLQRFKQKYEVNGQPVSNPEGMTGTELVAKVLEITAPRTALENLRTVANRAGLHLSNIIFSGVADAEALLPASIREEGAVILDFGAGTVDYMAICNNVVAVAGALAIGGAHLTNDLALAFNTSQQSAEEMKLHRGAAMLQPALKNERYQLRSTFSTTDRSISVHAIQTVTTERVDETLRIIRNLLSDYGVLTHIHGGLYLTGGTANLAHITEQASNIFGLPCSGGVPYGFTDLPEAILSAPERYSTALGLLRNHARTLADRDQHRSILTRIANFFRG